MSKTVHHIVADAEARGDSERLQQLRVALTKHRHISRYAGLSDDEAQRASEIVSAALARLARPSRGKRVAARSKPLERVDLGAFDQADLFADIRRWPRRPYCSDDLSTGLRIRGLRQAIQHPYIQANPPHLRVWALFDIDRAGAATAWEGAGLPPPAWTAVNKANGHAHSAWGLSAPVLVDGLEARDAPMRYLAAVEALMREQLQADSGYSGLITKNPAHPLWRTLRGPRLVYELSELASALPNLEKYKPRGRADQVGLGRNVALFDALRKWSYKGIRAYWGGGLQAWNAWLSNCNSHGLTLNADMFGGRHLDGQEVWHIAKSVAKWTWRTFSPQQFSDWQAAQGKKGGVRSGQVRREASEDKRASARLMRAQGMTQAAIAQELDVHVNTVAGWLKG